MKRLLLTIIMALAAQGHILAQPQFAATSQQLRMGDILFQTPRDVTFEFRNRGNQPLVITEVHPSCGCINVDYPQEPIMAGRDGRIVATYDARLLGTFHRELAVYTNIRPEPFYLAFEGRVVETALDYEADFPIDLGNVRLNANYIEFDDVNKGDKPVSELLVVNTASTPYSPQLMHLPAYLSAEYLPATVQPGRVGKIRITLDSDRLFLDGLNQTSLYLARRMGDKISEQNEILVSAILLPAFSDRTSVQMENAPHLVIMDGDERIEQDIALNMNGKRHATKRISLTNVGEEPLNITALQVFNRAVSVSLSDRNIKPHDTVEMRITIDAKELAKAKNGPKLLLISNDPRHAKTTLNINIEEQTQDGASRK